MEACETRMRNGRIKGLSGNRGRLLWHYWSDADEEPWIIAPEHESFG